MKVVSVLVALLFSFPNLPVAQQSSPSSAQSTQRDPQALTVLSQALASSGGLSTLSAIQDYTESGTITYSWAGKPESGSVTIYGRNLSAFRMDSSLPSGTQSLVAINGAAKFVRADGTSIFLPPYTLTSQGPIGFPLAIAISALGSASVAMSYVEQTTWNGIPVDHVKITQPADPTLPASDFSTLATYELFLSTTSHQLVGLSETVHSDQDVKRTYTRELIFSNYSLVNGVSIPFALEERIGQVQTWTIKLSSVTFNSGLTDSVFTL